ncbi:hypothetical protein PIB30_035746 [Stylosanthes scabra]|uniref:RNase H type-1 domain-containing protein n=1 Tax=Stylosanthes scabra TaxID=79078 RepID=A0ABU6RDE4_9FABA|nr:hypothetical protein [Stylosanthes scabra]
MVKAPLFIDAELHWCVRSKASGADALAPKPAFGRATQGYGAYALALWCVYIGSINGLLGFACDLLVPLALSNHFRSAGFGKIIRLRYTLPRMVMIGDILFVVALWWIWCDRNNNVFCPMDPWRVGKVLALCRSSARDYSFFYDLQQSSLECCLRFAWNPPPLNVIKINCDGSLMAHGHLAGFGPCLAWEYGFRQVICETNSLDAYKLLNFEAFFVMEHTDLDSKIKNMELWPWSFCIKLIQQMAKSAAVFGKTGNILSFGLHGMGLPSE